MLQHIIIVSLVSDGDSRYINLFEHIIIRSSTVKVITIFASPNGAGRIRTAWP